MEHSRARIIIDGAVAGIIARTDAQRGVWKAPAGNDATLNGVVELAVVYLYGGSPGTPIWTSRCSVIGRVPHSCQRRRTRALF